MNAKTEVGKEIVNVTKDLGGMVSDVINTIADKLSVPVSHVYDVLRTQMIIEGISAAVIFLTVIMCFSIVSIRSYEHDFFVRTAQYRDEEPTRWAFIFGLSIALLVLFLGMFMYSFTDIVSKIFNPDYHVLRTITEMTKDLVRK